METTFIVTGRHRTGTSMMMRCIDLSSDLLAEYDKNSDELMKLRHADVDGYHPNPNGYYLSRYHIFPQDIPGGLIKLSLQNTDWARTEKGNYKVIWMVRDEEERKLSWLKAFGKEEDEGTEAGYLLHERQLLDRDDCSFVFVNYAQCLKRPLETFETIEAAGWPIDSEKAASFVDASLYRNRAGL